MTKKYDPNERTDQNSRKKKNLNDKEIANLSDIWCRVQNTSNQDAHRNELGCKMKEQMKATWSEIKQNIQGTNSKGKETRTQINSLEQKEEITIQPKQNEETRIQKNEDRLKSLWDNFKCSNIQIIGASEGEEEQQEIENLFAKMMENFLNLAKEIDF